MTVTIKKSLAVSEIEPGIIQVTIDMPGSSANVLTTDLFAELDATFSELQQRTDLKGLILFSAKPSIFVAGADLKRIVSTLDWPDDKIIKFCEDGRAVMARLSQMPFVTVAAIHGACVGGGLELALWCDRRIASDDRKTILGLPEVKLGLVPGWAGTVRLPRIASLETAADLITSGRNARASEALDFGFVDQVVSKDQLIESAVAEINEESQRASYLETRSRILRVIKRKIEPEKLRAEYLSRIQSNTAIHPLAPTIVLEHILATAEVAHDEACHGESLAMAKVYGSDPSYGLLNNFFLAEHNRRNPGFVDLELAEKSIAAVGIVGTGLMGTSIAEICLKRKCDVILFDADNDALERVTSYLTGLGLDASIHAASSYQDFADCDLVLESVVEVCDIKHSVLKRIEEAVSTEAIIATNTSAIPLSKLSGPLKNAERFCGIHFCHPQLMQLVEVVKAEYSSPETIAIVTAWIRQLRKIPVVVKDHAGFVVNRLLAAMLDQAFRLFSQGVEIAEIDAAMRDFGFRGGPFEIVDVIGADVCMYAGREMWDGGVKCVTLSPILPRLVKKGWLGRKSGRGFYRYQSIDGPGIPDADVTELLSSYIDENENGQPGFDANGIADSICAAITLEASRILDDGVVANPKDIDICIINGFSFPDHVGGILFRADRIGISNVVSQLEKLSVDDEKLYPTDSLLKMAEVNASFYSS